MLPHDVLTPWHYLAATHEAQRHRDEARRHAHRRALYEARPAHPPLLIRLRAALPNSRRRGHALTDYPCRLADGTMGRVAVVQVAGEWTTICQAG